MSQSPFRTLDNVVLALERGIPDVIGKVAISHQVHVGVLVETAIYINAYPEISGLLEKQSNSVVASSLTTSLSHPLVHMDGGNGVGLWGFLSFDPGESKVRQERIHQFQLAALKAMRFRRNATAAKQRLCGAIGEMIDNVYEHSEAVSTGLAGFYADDQVFQLSIGDSGIGILASLRKNPAYGFLQDAGSAMAHALEDGVSRYGSAADRGRGFGVLFRALNTLDADLRFRSGAYSLELTGRNVTLRQAKVSQKAQLNGFVVSLSLTL